MAGSPRSGIGRRPSGPVTRSPAAPLELLLRVCQNPSILPLLSRIKIVTQTDDLASGRLSVRWRLCLAAAATCLLAPLTTAACLRPDPAGLGTHRQLGLPPCTFVYLFETRCPSCGMTTAWSHAVRGHWLQAGRANAGGVALAACAMLAAPWLLISAARGRWWIGAPSEGSLACLGVGVAALTLADWAYRLWSG